MVIIVNEKHKLYYLYLFFYFVYTAHNDLFQHVGLNGNVEVHLLPFYSFGCDHRSVQPARFPCLTILGPKLSVACTRSAMATKPKKASQNKSCKRTGYMLGALCNKLLTIYATAKTGWEVNPPPPPWLCVSLPVCLYISVICVSFLSCFSFCLCNFWT